jgi:hypothetical protein
MTTRHDPMIPDGDVNPINTDYTQVAHHFAPEMPVRVFWK